MGSETAFLQLLWQRMQNSDQTMEIICFSFGYKNIFTQMFSQKVFYVHFW